MTGNPLPERLPALCVHPILCCQRSYRAPLVFDTWLLSDDTCITSAAYAEMEGDGWILLCGLRLLAAGYACVVRFGCQLHRLTFVGMGRSCNQ